MAQEDPKTSSYKTSNVKSTNSKVNISNVYKAVSYLKKVKGDGNYTIAHGSFGMSNDPYATIKDDNDTYYYVYHDGRIEQWNDNNN